MSELGKHVGEHESLGYGLLNKTQRRDLIGGRDTILHTHSGINLASPSTYSLDSDRVDGRHAHEIGGTTFPIPAPDGTALVPIYSFALDPNTGAYRIGDDILGFATGGIERLRIDVDGNVIVARQIKIMGGIPAEERVLTSNAMGLGTWRRPAVIPAFVVRTVDYTLLETDSAVAGDATFQSITLTLPSAVGIVGRQYTIKKIDSSPNTVTVDAHGSERIDDELTQTILFEDTSITIVSDGANWRII